MAAVDSRITAAVFGLHWPGLLAETAKRITIPRESGLALFDAFASKEKTLHANAGRHKETPRFETDSAVRFFTRYLDRA
ncbi:hypothetical protein [Nonomuraea sp. NPDC049625]|uniref:hypothetical protein n=1 Tax=Nonomuraea sp. NPDC049625 TaxID=3155775 RepID=UPI0034139DD4